MSRVVVIGGGFGAMASAVRLAKRGHQVTLFEQSAQLGGALSAVERDGFIWQNGPTTTGLPGVIRDLFRKSGRPLERELDLVPRTLLREHRFADGSRVALPGGSRGVQIDAINHLGAGLGEQWASYAAGFADEWDLLRRHFFERPWREELTSKEVRRVVLTRRSLERRLRQALRDDRLRTIARHHALAAGQDPRNLPEWAGVTNYLEQNFGLWTVPGGMHRLTEVLAARLSTRGVEVHLNTAVNDVVVRDGQAVAVRTNSGEIDADHVVCAIDPRHLPALAAATRRTMPAMPPVLVHLGLEADGLPVLPAEVVLHGDPTLVVRTDNQAPDGAAAWTVLGRGLLSEDIVLALARHGIDVRKQVRLRIDRTARDQAELWQSSPMGVLSQGRGGLKRRLNTARCIGGVHLAGAHAVTGSGLPWVGLSAALVTQEIGDVAR